MFHRHQKFIARLWAEIHAAFPRQKTPALEIRLAMVFLKVGD
jgi:hypothetical protein